MPPEGFSGLDMFSEGNDAHPVGCDSPLQADSNGRWCIFLKFELTGSGVAACCLLKWLFGRLQIKKICAEWPLLSAAGFHTGPDHSAE